MRARIKCYLINKGDLDYMFHVIYVPQLTRRKQIPKGGGIVGRGGGHNPRYNDVGIFYRDGMGCELHSNCFTCPYPDCRFQHNNRHQTDLQFLANRGNGIKP